VIHQRCTAPAARLFSRRFAASGKTEP